MKRLMVLIAVTGFVLLSFNVRAFAWDPSGTWGNEGRTDVKMVISCKGNICDLTSQSNYSKFKARGFVNGDKMVLAYNHMDETEYGFMSFEKQDQNSMLVITYNPKGKALHTPSKLLRQ